VNKYHTLIIMTAFYTISETVNNNHPPSTLQNRLNCVVIKEQSKMRTSKRKIFADDIPFRYRHSIISKTNPHTSILL
jgi:hypothetical protein